MSWFLGIEIRFILISHSAHYLFDNAIQIQITLADDENDLSLDPASRMAKELGAVDRDFTFGLLELTNFFSRACLLF